MQLFKVIVFFLMLTPLHSFAFQQLKMGYIEFSPYYFTGDDGLARGHLVDLAKVLATTAGYTLTLHKYPPKRVAKAVVSGDVDIFLGMPTLKGFQSGVEISSIPIDTIHLMAYSRKPMPPLKTKSDLHGHKFIILRGYTYGDWADYIRDKKNKISYVFADTHEQALALLLRGRGDYLLDYELPIRGESEKFDVDALHALEVMTLRPHIMISQKMPNAVEVMNNFEAAYKILFPQGVKALKDHYIQRGMRTQDELLTP